MAGDPSRRRVGPSRPPARQEAVPLVVPSSPVAGVDPPSSSFARFWSARSGIDAAVLDALGAGRVDDAAIVEPSTDELVDQLTEEVDASAKHLRKVLASYWDPDWRRRHKGVDTSPEDQLWRAAQAAVEIADALNELRH